MGFVAPLLASVGTAVTAGGTLSTLLTVGSTVAGLAASRANTRAQQQAANFQASVAQRNAQMLQNNAADTRQAGQINQQERDMESAAILAEDQTRMAGSGFELNSTTFNRRTRAGRILARRDALRIRQDADRDAVSMENQADGEQVTAQSAKRAGRNALVAGLFDVGSGLIDGATMVNRNRALRINREARGVTQPYA